MTELPLYLACRMLGAKPKDFSGKMSYTEFMAFMRGRHAMRQLNA